MTNRHPLARLIRTAAVPVLAALLAAAPSHAQTDLDRFRLWNDCGAVDLVVEDLSDDADGIGLTKTAVETAARSRLRAARLYDDTAVPGLYVVVHVVGHAFSITTEFNKWVTDANGLRGYAGTWRTRGTGTHGGGDAGYILSLIAQHMDRFIDEYLRVNADAC